MVDKDKKLEVVKGKSYMEQYQEAKIKGKLKRRTYRIHTWSEDTAHLTGEVLSVKEFKGGTFDAVVNAYTIATDEGVVSCVLGSATDSQLEGTDLIGQLVHIEYCGKKELVDGRQVNLFNVDVLS